ncbi:MAG: hypothetical protein HQL41_12055 [Alphaproteobacteria bacterium]|nr:hypothetical protein [Alphaproteobacteria bacterium]
MLGKMMIHALLAAALIGSAATVFAQDDGRDSVSDDGDRVAASTTDTSQGTKPNRHRDNDRDHDGKRDRDHDRGRDDDRGRDHDRGRDRGQRR